ncbi:MAG TPA: hypothetical protein VJ697_16830, partial [Nitrososphaeraceae archaeon]|nr:hypothetical protein [Nitrososphaeraceae archaeon]
LMLLYVFTSIMIYLEIVLTLGELKNVIPLFGEYQNIIMTKNIQCNLILWIPYDKFLNIYIYSWLFKFILKSYNV